MNFSPTAAFHALVAGAMLWLVLGWLGSRLQIRRRPRTTQLVFGVVAVALLFLPLGGNSLWSRAFSVYPNPSLPMLGLLCAALWQRLLGLAIFRPADWRATWVAGAVAGTALYLNPLVFGSVDLYYWGWERDTAPWVLAALATGFLIRGNRLGVLLLAGLMAYAVTALESHNCWDYVMDPIYWLASLAALGLSAFRAARRRFDALRSTRDDPSPAILPAHRTPPSPAALERLDAID